MSCFWHKLVVGFGGMGDGYVCVKCGWMGYYRPLNSSTLPKRNDEIHFNTAPYIRRFESPVVWGMDTGSWTHYWDAKGVLQIRGTS